MRATLKSQCVKGEAAFDANRHVVAAEEGHSKSKTPDARSACLAGGTSGTATPGLER